MRKCNVNILGFTRVVKILNLPLRRSKLKVLTAEIKKCFLAILSLSFLDKWFLIKVSKFKSTKFIFWWAHILGPNLQPLIYFAFWAKMLPCIRFYDCSKMGGNLKFSKVDANRKLNESFVKYETETNWSLVELTLRFWVLFKIVFSKLSLLGGSIQENYINDRGKGYESDSDQRFTNQPSKCLVQWIGPSADPLDKRTGTNADLKQSAYRRQRI